MDYLTCEGYWIKIDPEDILLYENCKIKFSKNYPYIYNTDGQAIHRILMDAKSGEFVDHKNGDTFDNCKNNLRKISLRANGQNNILRRAGTTKSIYVGVTSTQSKKLPWRVRIYRNKQHESLGSCENEHIAGLVYNVENAERFDLNNFGGWNLIGSKPIS